MENKNYLLKKLEEIKRHFDTITDEEFEIKLIDAGYGEIQSLEESNLDFWYEQEVNASARVYEIQVKDYKYDSYYSSYKNYSTFSEVA